MNLNRTKRTMQFIMIAIFAFLILSCLNEYNLMKQRQQEEAERQERIRVAEELKRKREKAREEAKQRKIQEVIDGSKFGKELAELYEEYAEIEEILLKIDAYPEWLLEYFITHEEAINFVLEYPEYMELSKKELKKEGKKEIPKDEPEQNGIPMLYQWDQRWGYLNYGVDPIAKEGCGPTCLSMVVVGLTGKRDITPLRVAEYAYKNGYYVEESGTSWSLMEKGARHYGLSSKQISSSSKEVKKALKSGKAIICSVGEGDFTTMGHFIVITGLNKDGTVNVNDPNSRLKSEKDWKLSRVLDQTKAVWAIGKKK